MKNENLKTALELTAAILGVFAYSPLLGVLVAGAIALHIWSE
ncbi:MAG: hypothetical protein ACLFV6_16415 [Spirulinaceae cyanobacterium]